MRNLFVPESLDLSMFSKPEKAARILDMIIRRRFLSNLRSNKNYSGRHKDVFYSDRWVTIPSRTLKNIQDDYSTTIDELLDYGVIERDYFSRSEHKAYSYRFTKEYRDSLLKCVSFRPKNEKWFDRWLQDKREKEKKTLAEKKGNPSESAIHGYLLALDQLNSITLEYEKSDIDDLMWKIRKREEAKRREARQKRNPTKRKRRSRKDAQGITGIHKCNHIFFKLHEIIEGRQARLVPFYCVDNYGRFHYFLTNLPKSLRPFIRLNGKQVVGYDITSSQCIFFAMAVRDEAKSRDGINFHYILNEIERLWPNFFRDKEIFLHKEMLALGKENQSDISYSQRRSYRKRQLEKEIEILFQALSEDFYRFLMKKAGIRWKTKVEFKKKRKTFKENFFEFLYGPNKKRSRIFRAFQKTFPYITLVLWKMKNLGGMFQRYQELQNEKISKTEAWKQVKREAKKEKKWYVGLPLRMQETEADFMFNRIAPKINRPFLPVHDCIIVEKTERRNVKDIAKLLKDEFRKLGVEAHIDDDDWAHK